MPFAMPMIRLVLRALRYLCIRIGYAVSAGRVASSYAIKILELRRRRGERIRVLFLVNDLAKWKYQRLFELLAKTERFEPFVALTLADEDGRYSDREQRARYQVLKDYFSERAMPAVDAYDFLSRQPIDLRGFSPDIVFYQQPWGLAREQSPEDVCLYALTAYVPYYVPNYGAYSMDLDQDFHRYLWRYFMLNDEWVRLFTRHRVRLFCAGQIIATGHPQLDWLADGDHLEEKGECVIYAPHWSIPHPRNPSENYSTFLHTGQLILDYAKSHPEYQWVFRPHPTLMIALRKSGAWSQDQIDRYWAQWAEIGEIDDQPDYIRTFRRARALITDCASFLIEYFATGKPLIRLVSKDMAITPLPPSRKLFEKLYNAHDETEMMNFIERVIERKDDWRRNERLEYLSRIGLLGRDASAEIANYLENAI